jgi:hypothetical protein
MVCCINIRHWWRDARSRSRMDWLQFAGETSCFKDNNIGTSESLRSLCWSAMQCGLSGWWHVVWGDNRPHFKWRRSIRVCSNRSEKYLSTYLCALQSFWLKTNSSIRLSQNHWAAKSWKLTNFIRSRERKIKGSSKWTTKCKHKVWKKESRNFNHC